MEKIDNPLVSYCIITYNQENYIIEALNSAVAQDYENLEIIVSDDNSPDRTYELAQEFVKKYNGPYKIILNKNPQNLRISGNVNKCIELAHGDYILIVNGDDASLPNRTRLSVEKLNEAGCLSLTFNMNQIDSVSNFVKTLFPKGEETRVFSIDDYVNDDIISAGPSRVLKRKLVDIFGPINPKCPTDDSVFNVRAILSGGLGYCSIPTVNYRVHGENVSSTVSLLTRFDPSLIYNQYVEDLETAKSKKLISLDEYEKLKSKFDSYLLYERLKRELYNKKTFLKRLLLLARWMFNKDITFNKKKEYIWLYLSWCKHHI